MNHRLKIYQSMNKIQKMKIHHIGIVVNNISRSLLHYESTNLGKRTGNMITDPLQEVNVQFLRMNSGDSSKLYLELIEPIDESSHINSFLKRGGGVNHLCFEVNNLEEAIESLKKDGARLISDPKPAIAFNGLNICFIMNNDMTIIELIENPNQIEYDFEKSK